MKLKKLIFFFLLVSFASVVALNSCVSVKIGDATTKRSSRYSFENPSKDFYRIKDEAVDVAWLSQATSATLSVKTKCMKNIDVDLDNWLIELMANFRASELISSEKVKFSNRKAVRAVLKTSLEGFDNQLAITSFIKNSCQYIILLTSPPASFQNDLDVYDKFLASFKAW